MGHCPERGSGKGRTIRAMTDDDLFGVDLNLIGDVAAVASSIYLHDWARF